MNENQKIKYAVFVSIVTIMLNIILSAIKFIAGVIGNSSALVSDAVHSLSDVFSTFVVIIGVKLAKSDIDDDHQYGHEKFECVAGITLSVILMITGLGIGFVGIEKIYIGEYLTANTPSNLALYGAIISIVIKELMFWYTYKAGKKVESTALVADAWHHRSDALSSIGSLVGIIGAQMGYLILDPLASIFICFFIGKVAIEIFSESSDKVIDKACDKETYDTIFSFITSYPEIKNVDLLKTRQFSNKIYIDVEVAMEGYLSLYEAHSIAEKLHDGIENQFPQIKHCMIHVNPTR